MWRKTIFKMADGIITHCSGACSSGMMTVNPTSGSTCNVIRGSGMTCYGIHPNVHHIGILHLVSILTISTQSTCQSTPVCEILSKSDHLQQKKMTSCRFSKWQILAILDFRCPIIIMGSLKTPCK